MKVSDLIALLKKHKAKYIAVKGTMLLPDSGNFIVLSTEKQY